MPYLALAVNNYRLMENIVNKFILWVWEKFLPLCAKNKPKKKEKDGNSGFCTQGETPCIFVEARQGLSFVPEWLAGSR
jgi:hypothetical protein